MDTQVGAGDDGAYGARVSELEGALDDARARAELERDALNTMTHELRTPMNGVLGMTQLLLETSLDAEQRSMVQVIRHSTQALLTLVNDSLDYARMDAGRMQLETLDFDLRVTMGEIAALLAPLASEKRIGLECRVHHEVPSRLHGDPGRLRQVMLNLAGNAIKFTDEGSVTLRVERVEESDTQVRLRFTVTDTGIGVTDAQRERLFQAFEQGDPSIARRFGGTGLGLAVSRRLVTLMGGQIELDSEPGRGSTFGFTIALALQSARTDATPAEVALTGVRVLVADPSRAMRGLIAERMGGWGCIVAEAEGRDEALEMLRAGVQSGTPYALAVIDRFIDGGADALGTAIRDDQALTATRTVLMTSVGRRGEAREALDQGFSAYLTKPIEWETLADALAEVLRTPAAEHGARVLVTRHTVAEARRSRVRILLAEDNVVNQLVTRWALQRLGCTIEVASTGREALDAHVREPFDLIITDLQMPDMDGIALTQALRAHEREQGLPRAAVLALTGSTAEEQSEACRAAGMDAFLAKPVDLVKLGEMVTTLTEAGRRADPAGDAMAGTPVVDAAAPDVTNPSSPVFTLVPPAAQASDPGAALDATGALDLDQLDEMSMGIARLRTTLLDTFLAEVHPRLDRLREAATAADPARAEFEAHGLKTMSGTVGATSCQTLFEDIEHRAREGESTSLAALIRRAFLEVVRAERAIGALDREARAA